MHSRQWLLDERASLDSTQDVILAQPDGPDGWVVYTEDQRRGRGRHARTWSMPAGAGIAMSMLIRPRVRREQWPWLGVALGLAARDVLIARGLPAQLKWPNDVVVPHDHVLHKIAGILTTAQDDVVVLGLGINTRMTHAQRPIEQATSLAMEGASDVDGRSLVDQVLSRFSNLLERLESGESLQHEYERACSTLGQHVRVTRVDGTVCHGRATGVTDTGALVVVSDGQSQLIAAADVEHVRPA